MKLYLLISFSLLFLSNGLELTLAENSFDESTYFTTWATAVYATEAPKLELTKNTIRQIVHVSASGENLRLKISNIEGKTKLEIKDVTIADSLSQGTGDINLNTLTPLTFSGKSSVVVPPGEEIYSDTTTYKLRALSEIAISISFGETPEKLTGHPASRTNSFIEKGNKVYNQTISRDNKIAHWYFIAAVEVSSKPRKNTIVCFGDSITDGTGSNDDKQNRWPDLLSTKLHLNKDTSDIAVVNKGIGGNRITTQGLQRFGYDVLGVKGVTHIIVLYGVNDINALNATSKDIITAYKELISQAHKKKLLIYAGTILPYGNHGRWTKEREKYRQEVNEWIRTTKVEDGGFDGFFDFDELIRDPEDPTVMYSSYDCGDGLHPSPEGYQQLVQAIDDLEIFTKKGSSDNDEIDEIKLFGSKGVKFEMDFKLKKGEEIVVNIRGRSWGSLGFRVLTANDKQVKTSDYRYTGKIGEGTFDLVVTLKATKDSSSIIIRRPISTINIEKIILDYLEVSTEDKHQVFEMSEGSLLQ